MVNEYLESDPWNVDALFKYKQEKKSEHGSSVSKRNVDHPNEQELALDYEANEPDIPELPEDYSCGYLESINDLPRSDKAQICFSGSIDYNEI